MNIKESSSDLPSKNKEKANPLTLGTSYLDYCVRKGWLEKSGDGLTAQYNLTETGKKKLADTPLNFDLSAIASKTEGPKKRRKRHKK
jgi:hypothetical protein